MLEERLARVEGKVDDLGRELSELRRDVQTQGEAMRAEGAELRAEMRAQGAELREEIRAQGVELREEMKAQGVELRAEMQAQGAELRHEMRLLHEDVLANIRDLAPDFSPIRREFRQADAALRESIEPRVSALEAAERSRRTKH